MGKLGEILDNVLLHRIAWWTLTDFRDQAGDIAEDPGAVERDPAPFTGGLVTSPAVSAKSVRVMIVDDHEVVRDGLRAVLGREPDMSVVGEAATASSAVQRARELKPDVVVMDVRLGDSNGIEATREIRSQRPSTRVLILTSFADDEALYSSVLAGAAGYVLKQVRVEGLLRAIRAVAAGENLIGDSETSAMMSRLERGKHLHRD